MNTITRTTVVAAVSVWAALLTPVLPASAVPSPDPAAPIGQHASPASEPGVAQLRPCFLWRAHWNEALDGPQPTCPQR